MISTPQRPEDQDFFLTKDTELGSHHDTPFRVVLVALVAFLAILGLIVVFAPHRYSGWEYWALAGILWATAAFFVGILASDLRAPKLADVVTLTSDSLRIQYTNGDVDRILWRDPELGLTLFDYNRDQSRFPDGRITLVLPSGRRFRAPSALRGALLAAARRAEVPILERIETFSAAMGGIGDPLVTRIGKPEMTPLWRRAGAASS